MVEPRAFLERWSRLKRRAATQPAPRRPAVEPAAEAPPNETAPAAAPPVGEAAADPPSAAADEADATELPAVESLTGASDYRPFMRAEVPDALRNEALRRLWASDPVYANLDGLLEYGEDFGEPFRAAGIVATAYRVLEGMPAPAAEEPGAPAPAEPAALPPVAASSAAQLAVNDLGEDGRREKGGLESLDNNRSNVGPVPAPRPASSEVDTATDEDPPTGRTEV